MTTPVILRHPESRCPVCGMWLSATATADGSPLEPPTPNDVTLCTGCASLLGWTADGQVCRLTPAQLEALRHDEEAWPVIAQAQRAIVDGSWRARVGEWPVS